MPLPKSILQLRLTSLKQNIEQATNLLSQLEVAHAAQIAREDFLRAALTEQDIIHVRSSLTNLQLELGKLEADLVNAENIRGATIRVDKAPTGSNPDIYASFFQREAEPATVSQQSSAPKKSFFKTLLNRLFGRKSKPSL